MSSRIAGTRADRQVSRVARNGRAPNPIGLHRREWSPGLREDRLVFCL